MRIESLQMRRIGAFALKLGKISIEHALYQIATKNIGAGNGNRTHL